MDYRQREIEKADFVSGQRLVGNQYMTALVADRVNQETPAIAVELGAAAAALELRQTTPRATQFDRHGGVGETSAG